MMTFGMNQIITGNQRRYDREKRERKEVIGGDLARQHSQLVHAREGERRHLRLELKRRDADAVFDERRKGGGYRLNIGLG